MILGFGFGPVTCFANKASVILYPFRARASRGLMFFPRDPVYFCHHLEKTMQASPLVPGKERLDIWDGAATKSSQLGRVYIN